MSEKQHYALFSIKPSESQKKAIEYVRKFCEENFGKSLDFVKVNIIRKGGRLHKIIEKSLGKGPLWGALLGLEIYLFQSKRRELYIDVLFEEFVHVCRPELSEDEAQGLIERLLQELIKYLRTNHALYGCFSPWARDVLNETEPCEHSP